MICGSRFATDTGYIAPISRRTGIHLFAFLLSRLLRQPVTDPTSGFRLYNHRAIALFARDYPHDYPEVEAVLMLHHHRLTMREVPVTMLQRGGGVSSIGGSGKSFYYMVKVLLALFVGLGRRARRAGARASRPRWPRTTGSDGRPAADRRDRRRRRRCCCSCSSWCAGARSWSATRCCGCSARVVILGLAVWDDALTRDRAARWASSRRRTRCSSSPSAFILLLLLHFSAAMSRLSDQSKVLAQRQAMLEQRLRQLEQEHEVTRQRQLGERDRDLEPVREQR